MAYIKIKERKLSTGSEFDIQIDKKGKLSKNYTVHQDSYSFKRIQNLFGGIFNASIVDGSIEIWAVYSQKAA